MSGKIILTVLITIASFGSWAQTPETPKTTTKIHWITYKEAVQLNKEGKKRKIITDVFTEWCGWCKRMDASTFNDQAVADYVNKYFWAVKFDAETKDTIVIDKIVYVNQHPSANRSTHDLAQKLLQNQMSYPSYVFLNEANQAITIVPGYYPASDFMLVLRFIAENVYLTKPFAQFKAENSEGAVPKN